MRIDKAFRSWYPKEPFDVDIGRCSSFSIRECPAWPKPIDIVDILVDGESCPLIWVDDYLAFRIFQQLSQQSPPSHLATRVKDTLPNDMAAVDVYAHNKCINLSAS